MLSGKDDLTCKINLLNKMLIDWVGNLKVKRGSNKKYHSPASLNTMLRRFFAAMKDKYDWQFATSDFGFDGGYVGFFRDLCERRLAEDVSEKKKIYVCVCVCFFFMLCVLTSR